MAERVIQSSFNVGELAPALWARTDLAKYHSAAALLRNFFVDYRGGASTRPGTRFINQCYKSASRVRLIPFQASFDVDYVLEFGEQYIRFINNGAPVLEAAIPAGAVNQYAPGDWVYISGTGTALDGNYYIVTGTAPLKLTDLFNNPVATPTNGSTARVYTIASPYHSADVAQIKFTQDVSTLILCHPNYTPYALNLITAANWALAPIKFGTAAGTPTNVIVTSSLKSGSVAYSYTVTAIDKDGNESGAAIPGNLTKHQDIRVANGSIRISWSPVPNAKSYNVYKSDVTYFSTVPPGVPYGYIGNTTGNTFDDSNIASDYTQSPPILQTTFLGDGIDSITVNSSDHYTKVPTATASPPTNNNSYPSVLVCVLMVDTVALSTGDNSANFAVGDTVSFDYGIVLTVATIGSGGSILTYQQPYNTGQVTQGTVPTTGVPMTDTSGSGTGARAVFTWVVGQIVVQASGGGYSAAPTITVAPVGQEGNGVSATAHLSSDNGISYPSVPAFFQQRLFLGGGGKSPATFYLSQPGRHYNFNISQPIQASDSINATLVSTQLNTIKGAVATSAGLIIFTDKATWLVSGGSAGSAISPSAIVANPQSYNGASDVPPIVSNYDILYVQAKGAIVRDSTYNIYANIYTGQDVSVLSSHLFYGHQILEWAFAEEPYKVIWAVRDDGVLLALTFLKEQEFTGWAHSDTVGGAFESVATVVEPANNGEVDAIYTVVNRTVNGQTVRYIERLMERNWQTLTDCWCVDCGIQYSGAPKQNFSGAQQLAGLTVTGLADGKVIPPFVMPASGAFALPAPASIVTVGIGFTAQLQTLPIDTGEPTVQGKQKRIVNATARLVASLSLKSGTDFNNLVVMKDTVLGNVGRMSNQLVTDLVTADAMTLINPDYNSNGQYVIQQDQPYPATVLGMIPTFEIGDSK